MNYLKTFLPYLFGNKKGKSLEVTLPDPLPADLTFEETLMFHSLKHSLDFFIKTLQLKTLSKKEIFHLLNFLPFLNSKNEETIKELFPNERQFFTEATKTDSLRKKELQELLDFKNSKLTIFVLLSIDRTKPGRMLIKNAEGEFVKNEKGHIWSIPILGLSGRGLPFHHSNGSTPTGIYTIDSVMPEANHPYEFGLHR